MNKPTISVIIPVYNIAQWLPRCLDSVLMQTYGNLEVIAVDDGSTDESFKILNDYAVRDRRIQAIHKKNGGVTSARLCGLEKATGEWIGFVDGDDEIEPEMYQRLLENACKFDADISHCGYQMIFPDERVHYFHNTGKLMEQNRNKGLCDLLDGSVIEPGLWNKLYKRELFHDMDQLMDSSIKINEDLLMNFYLFSKAEKSVFDDWCPYHYIVRKTSASHAKLNEHKIYDPIRVKEIIREMATADIREDAQRAYINTCINVYHSLISAGSGYRNDIRNIQKLLWREKASFSMLGKRRALMAYMIMCTPVIYKPVYGFYYRFLQKDIYS